MFDKPTIIDTFVAHRDWTLSELYQSVSPPAAKNILQELISLFGESSLLSMDEAKRLVSDMTAVEHSLVHLPKRLERLNLIDPSKIKVSVEHGHLLKFLKMKFCWMSKSPMQNSRQRCVKHWMHSLITSQRSSWRIGMMCGDWGKQRP